jgi:hypothetical protein
LWGPRLWPKAEALPVGEAGDAGYAAGAEGAERSAALRFTIVYDNETLNPNLASAWGFACLVGDDLLLDTGGDARRLLSNMEKMGIDPVESIKFVPPNCPCLAYPLPGEG